MELRILGILLFIFFIAWFVAPKKRKVAVRRGRGKGQWMIADEDHRWFSGDFVSGIMKNVSFIHQAQAMTCEHGYESTGEAVGVLALNTPGEVTSFETLPRIEEIFYERDRRQFLLKNNNKIVERCDYLHLRDDGTALAGWAKA